MSICQHMWFSKGPFPMSVVKGKGVVKEVRVHMENPEQKGAHKNIKNGKSKCCLHIFGQMFAVGNDPLAGLLSCGCSTPQITEKALICHYFQCPTKLKWILLCFLDKTFFKLNCAQQKRTN